MAIGACSHEVMHIHNHGALSHAAASIMFSGGYMERCGMEDLGANLSLDLLCMPSYPSLRHLFYLCKAGAATSVLSDDHLLLTLSCVLASCSNKRTNHAPLAP